MEAKRDSMELNEVLDLFISSGEDSSAEAKHDEGSTEMHKEDSLRDEHIEENTTVRKEILFPPGPRSQEKIKGLLFEYLQANYVITSVELQRTVDTAEDGKRIHREEEVLLLLKDAQ